jgi:hypothetical protein
MQSLLGCRSGAKDTCVPLSVTGSQLAFQLLWACDSMLGMSTHLHSPQKVHQCCKVGTSTHHIVGDCLVCAVFACCQPCLLLGSSCHSSCSALQHTYMFYAFMFNASEWHGTSHELSIYISVVVVAATQWFMFKQLDSMLSNFCTYFIHIMLLCCRGFFHSQAYTVECAMCMPG